MVGSIWMEGIISQKSQSDERAAMESATAVATEAIVSIKTVQSLGNFNWIFWENIDFIDTIEIKNSTNMFFQGWWVQN